MRDPLPFLLVESQWGEARKKLGKEQEEDGCAWCGKPCTHQEWLQGKEGMVEVLSTGRWSSVRIKGRLERAKMNIPAEKTQFCGEKHKIATPGSSFPAAPGVERLWLEPG